MVRQHQTSDAQLRIGESRDSGFALAHRPGMTFGHFPCSSRILAWIFAMPEIQRS
jgi:hypothetical protein